MKTLQVGDRVPEFTGHDQDGMEVALSDFKGKKLIVFFYPKANTPTCTVEACNLRDNYEKLRELGFELLGVSADSQRRQANFKKKYAFPYPLIADVDRTILNKFGVWGEKKFMGRTFDGIHRKTFVIDGDGIVTKVIEKVRAKDHAAQILQH